MNKRNLFLILSLCFAAMAITAVLSCQKKNYSNRSTKLRSKAGGAKCTLPVMPAYTTLASNAYLPDPFKMADGTRITTKGNGWSCRRAEIAAQAQEFQYGYYPSTPYSATSGTSSGNSIIVTVNQNGQTISFTCSITYPSTGTAPYPAMIGIGASNLNNAALLSQGVAIINFPNNDLAAQSGQASRGVGKFYTLFGSTHSAGALMAWAWGVGRLIDALEKTPTANIDAGRLGVTGCSRNGKGALAAGAFNERIDLTIPQEPGSGGSANWRVSDYQKSQGKNTQTLSQITGENVWFRANFNQFANTVHKLPFDQHEIMGLVAPRAILIVENDILWLGPESSWNNANAARTIWQALGVTDRFGYSLTTAHAHCSFPSSQQSDLDAYVQKFLIGGGTANTTIMKNEPGYVYDAARWVNWPTPTLQ